MLSANFVAEALSNLSPYGDAIHVSISNQIVHLLSDQLYQSPIKAIEELVVNAFDADATECRVYVPYPSDSEHHNVVVYDNGTGMSYDGLVDLWHIASSKKRNMEIETRRKRKQIGKFGIGKLAARTLAHKLTYITKGDDGLLSVSIDFRDFTDSPTGAVKVLETQVRRIEDWEILLETTALRNILGAANISQDELVESASATWTLALLEDFTEKARKLKHETLKWVLSTAMPLQADFRLYLNGTEIQSSKENFERVVNFDLSSFPKKRLENLATSTGEEWEATDKGLVSKSFPSGIRGSVIVTKQTLSGGKSDDLMRSHGYFIRVRRRLVNDTDALFGLKPLEHQTFNRFRADIEADDLDAGLKASRETVEESAVKEKFREVLREIFREADSQYDRWLREEDKVTNSRREGDRNEVPSRLVEHPIADALVTNAGSFEGAEADQSWFYVRFDAADKFQDLIRNFYSSERNRYQYLLTGRGRAARIVEFDPKSATFWINQDHEFAAQYVQDSSARLMLEDMVTAEAMLEIYMRQHQIPLNTIGRVLEQRDELLRSLAKDRSLSLDLIAMRLRDAATTDDNQLEIMLVVAARALGFIATHIGGGDEPDGLAKFVDTIEGETRITLEAKSSTTTPSLAHIDMAGLKDHKKKYGAIGCLLVAPSYPGSTKGNDSAVSRRAKEDKISCWTVEQLANVVASAEKRQLNARQVIRIVTNFFAPEDVTVEIDKLLADPRWDQSLLYIEILKALRTALNRTADTAITVESVTHLVSLNDDFVRIGSIIVEQALKDLQGASQGGMLLRDRTIVLQVSIDELERRVGHLTKDSGQPRRRSSFRQHNDIESAT